MSEPTSQYETAPALVPGENLYLGLATARLTVADLIGLLGYVNVKWYGATGDGATDDTPAITKARAAALAFGARRVYAPAGVYLITSTIQWGGDGTLSTPGLTLFGDRPNANCVGELVSLGSNQAGTVFRWNGAHRGQAMFDIRNANQGGFVDVGFYGLALDGASMARNAIRWHHHYGDTRSIYGWRVEGCYDSSFFDFAYNVDGTDGVAAGGTAGYGDASGLTFENCLFAGSFHAGQAASASSITVNVVAAAKTYTRTTGSWITDGFTAGDTVICSGFTNATNNGVKKVATVTATVMTMTETNSLVNESGNGNEAVVGCSAHIACTTQYTLGITVINSIAYSDLVTLTPQDFLFMSGGTAQIVGGGGAIFPGSTFNMRGQAQLDFPALTVNGSELQTNGRLITAIDAAASPPLRSTVLNGGLGDDIIAPIGTEMIYWDVGDQATLVINGTNIFGDVNVVAADSTVVVNGAVLYKPASGHTPAFTGHTERVTGTWLEGGTTVGKRTIAPPIYADNTAATGGGLVAGDVYMTSAGIMMVCLG